MRADAVRLRRVIDNVLSNAVKFSPDGGPIRLAVRTNADDLVLSVSDTGIGIPVAAAEHVFESFFRADNATARGIGGTGLGLALCRDIVDAHGGGIAVDEREGAGATVRIRIPIWHPT